MAPPRRVRGAMSNPGGSSTKRKSNPGNPSVQPQKSRRTSPPIKHRLKTPKVPRDTPKVNLENGLHDPPRREKEDRPWFVYDLIQPVAMFRKLPPEYWGSRSGRAEVDVSEGDDSDALSEQPGPDRKPVKVPGYVRKFVIAIPEDQLSSDSEIFYHDEDETFEIEIMRIVWPPTLTQEQKELGDPGSNDFTTAIRYEIHAGYRLPLRCMLREIRFMTHDNHDSHICLFRATYLMMILDLFADELTRAPKDLTARFRSKALNPLLQRQLRGISDHEGHVVKAEVGSTLNDATNFYLSKDPLDPVHINTVARNLLYIWHVRLALMYIDRPCKRPDRHHHPFTDALGGTNHLAVARGKVTDEDWEKEVLSSFELTTIKEDGLEVYYRKLMKVAGVNSDDDTTGEEDSAE